MPMNDFGFTTWGADLVRIAEPMSTSTPNTLAPIARRLARNHGVAIETAGRQVTARVHRGGSASLAHLEFEAMAPAAAVAVRDVLGAKTEPDDAAHAELVARGLRPAPVLAAADCSCRARTTRCVHVLAALYALAELVDHAPSTVLTIQSFADGAPSPATDPERPAPRWTPLASLHARDYYAVAQS